MRQNEDKERLMRVAIACDHAGFPLKELVVDAVREAGHSVIDLGTDSTQSVDYPDFARKLGQAIQENQADRGVLLCGSGVGACIAANKMAGIYAGICHDTYSAHQGVEHDNMNVLCLGARVIGPNVLRELVQAFLGASFTAEERHIRRLAKVRAIERDLISEKHGQNRT
jgi:ribose 5-phosphate isomerase B